METVGLIQSRLDEFLRSLPPGVEANPSIEMVVRVAFFAGYSNAIQHTMELEELKLTATEFIEQVSKELDHFSFLLSARPTSRCN